jgi:hypothetical protein
MAASIVLDATQRKGEVRRSITPPPSQASGWKTPAPAPLTPLFFGKRTCKPNSVVCGHSSRRRVAADAQQRPTRRFRDFLEPPERIGPMRSAARLLAAASLPIWSCSVWGLPCLRRYRRSGALLPHLFTLTPAPRPAANSLEADRRGDHPPKEGFGRGGIFSVALAVCGLLTPASRTLSGTLPCGVRTFLPRGARPRQRPPGPLAID